MSEVLRASDSDDVIVTELFSVVVLFEIWVFFYGQSERVMWFCLLSPEIRQNHRVRMKAAFVCCTEASV